MSFLLLLMPKADGLYMADHYCWGPGSKRLMNAAAEMGVLGGCLHNRPHYIGLHWANRRRGSSERSDYCFSFALLAQLYLHNGLQNCLAVPLACRIVIISDRQLQSLSQLPLHSFVG